MNGCGSGAGADAHVDSIFVVTALTSDLRAMLLRSAHHPSSIGFFWLSRVQPHCGEYALTGPRGLGSRGVMVASEGVFLHSGRGGENELSFFLGQ